MSQSAVTRVATIIAKVGGIQPDEPIGAETELVGGGIMLDSVGVLELLVALEKEFQVELRADELVKAGALRTVGALIQFMESRKSA